MAYGSVLTDTVQSSTAATAPVFKDGNGTEVGTLCRAWVYFLPNSGTPSIQASFNVSSITYNGAGNYTANFSNALVDAKYAAFGSSDYPGVWEEVNSGTRTTTALQFYTPLSTNGNPTTYGRCSVSVFR